VIQRAVNAATVRRADDHRDAEVAVRSITDTRGLLHDLVERRKDEVGELHLGDRTHPVERESD
jgi:hypothetical protein